MEINESDMAYTVEDSPSIGTDDVDNIIEMEKISLQITKHNQFWKEREHDQGN